MSYGPPISSDEYDEFDEFDDNYDDDGYEIRRKSRPPPQKTPEQIFREQLEELTKTGNLVELEKLLDSNASFNINLTSFGWTPLMNASFYTHPEVVKYLLFDRHVSPNTYVGSTTPLILACEQSNPSTEASVLLTVEHLLKAKAWADRQNAMGETALMMACRNGHESVVDLLLKGKSVSLEASDKQGNTAIFHAITNNRFNIVKRLIEANASIECGNREYASPRQCANYLGFYDIEALFPGESQCKVIPNEYTSINSYHDHIPTAFPERNLPAYVQDIFQMLSAMRVKNVQINMVEANIGLRELLLITEDQLTDIGVKFPFQRKRILHGLLKFHEYKFQSATMPPIGSHSKPMPIIDYFNLISRCLKYLYVMKCTLKFIEPEELYGKSAPLSTKSTEYIKLINATLKEILRLTIQIDNRMKYLEKHITPPPPQHITKERIAYLFKPKRISYDSFSKNVTWPLLSCVAMGAVAFSIFKLRK